MTAAPWTPEQLARYGMPTSSRVDLQAADLVPDFATDPPHVRAWRAELLRSCARVVSGVSVHRLERFDPIGDPVTVVAFFWPGDALRLAVLIDPPSHTAGIWSAWCCWPMLATSSADDFASLDDRPMTKGTPPFLVRFTVGLPCAAPYVLRSTWLQTPAHPACEAAAHGAGHA
jgi:hypothetical protein